MIKKFFFILTFLYLKKFVTQFCFNKKIILKKVAINIKNKIKYLFIKQKYML